MFNKFFFRNTGPFSPTRWHATFAQCSPKARTPPSPAATMARERNGPVVVPTSSNFCVALTQHASHRESSDALSIPWFPWHVSFQLIVLAVFGTLHRSPPGSFSPSRPFVATSSCVWLHSIYLLAYTVFANGGRAGKNWYLVMKARRWRINKNCKWRLSVNLQSVKRGFHLK